MGKKEGQVTVEFILLFFTGFVLFSMLIFSIQYIVEDSSRNVRSDKLFSATKVIREGFMSAYELESNVIIRNFTIPEYIDDIKIKAFVDGTNTLYIQEMTNEGVASVAAETMNVISIPNVYINKVSCNHIPQSEIYNCNIVGCNNLVKVNDNIVLTDCGNFELDCDNGNDDDGNDGIDCQDPDCNHVGICEHGAEQTCNDNQDNDGDGDIDCDDSDCIGAIALGGGSCCYTASDCGTGLDLSCVSCSFDNECVFESVNTVCNNAYTCSSPGNGGYDSDGNIPSQGYCDGTGYCDYARNAPTCSQPENGIFESFSSTICQDGEATCMETCGDGIDNDGNGDSDCDDVACANSAHCFMQSLIAYLPFDCSFENIVDGSSSVRNGNPQITSLGKYGNGMSLDGSSSLNINYDGKRDISELSNDFSFSAWFKTTDTIQIHTQSAGGTAGTSGQKYLFGPDHGGMSGTISGAGFSVGTNGYGVFEHANGYMPPLLFNSANNVGNNWRHLVVVYEDKTPTVYIDKIRYGPGLRSNKDDVYPPFLVGHQNYGGGTPVVNAFFRGIVDEVTIWDKALTQANIDELFNGDMYINNNIATCVETVCDDGDDNDFDGDVDCADSDCSSLPVCNQVQVVFENEITSDWGLSRLTDLQYNAIAGIGKTVTSRTKTIPSGDYYIIGKQGDIGYLKTKINNVEILNYNGCGGYENCQKVKIRVHSSGGISILDNVYCQSYCAAGDWIVYGP